MRLKTPPTLWTAPFIRLTVAHLLGALGYASMVLLPLYLSHLEVSAYRIGVIMSVAHFSGLITRPLVGWLLDRWGRRPCLAIGSAIVSVSLLSIYWVHDGGHLVYFSRILFGFGEGFIFTGYFALAADLIPSERRTEGLALFGVAGLLPLLVNPMSDLIGFSGASLRLFIASVSVMVFLSIFLILSIPKDEIKVDVYL